MVSVVSYFHNSMQKVNSKLCRCETRVVRVILVLDHSDDYRRYRFVYMVLCRQVECL